MIDEITQGLGAVVRWYSQRTTVSQG